MPHIHRVASFVPQIVVLLGVGINLVISTSALGEHWLS